MGYWWQYIRYFGYLAWNWNTRLAFFVLWHEWKGEQKYHSRTVGIDQLTDSIPEPDWLHASIYQPVNFYTAERLLEQLPAGFGCTGFLDAGCGKGRMLAVAAAKGFRKIYGFDLAADMCRHADRHIRELQSLHPTCQFQVKCCHARDYELSPDISVIFLFNPFDTTVMQPFVRQVKSSLEQQPRQLIVLYANPVCKEVWLQAGFVETFHFQKLTYLEGSVLEYIPKNKVASRIG